MTSDCTIVVTTYWPAGPVGHGREVAFWEALGSWRRHLRYGGRLSIHVADDGTPEGGLQGVEQTYIPFELSVSSQQRHGVGASLNAGMRVAFDRFDLALYVVDDWALSAPFDLTPWADLLRDDDSIGMIRLGPPHPALTGTVHHHDGLWTMSLDRHHFAFAHRPALYHRRMLDAYGAFDEDVNAYDCERLYSERFNAAHGPDIHLALPTPWYPLAQEEELELAHIDPRAG